MYIYKSMNDSNVKRQYISTCMLVQYLKSIQYLITDVDLILLG